MKWILPEHNNLSLIESLKKSRNILDEERFFNPSVNNTFDPALMYGINDAVKVITKALDDKKKIFIHGDYDVDGICATSIMWDFLFRKCKADVMPFIPSRFDEGYGLSDDSINSIIEQGGKLIITVDCGVKDIELVHKYKDKIDFLITDHHTVLTTNDVEFDSSIHKKVENYIISKDAKAVVHPRISDKYPFGDICGSAVSWKLCVAMNNALNLQVDMTKYLDLVALATVCDIMPLNSENRDMVAIGLETFRNTRNLGLQALAELCEVELSEVSAMHLGFVFGPRLNAAGRIDHAMDGVRLLTTPSSHKAFEMAHKLNNLNIERQELTVKYIEIADLQVNQANLTKLIFLSGQDWPEGIIGLIAGKLTEKYSRPVLIGSEKKGIIKGSARSIETFHIANAFKSLDKFLIAHGGHAQAAGFTLSIEHKEVFIASLLEMANTTLSDDDLIKSLKVDVIAKPKDLSIETLSEINKFEPFGFGNKKPVIALLNLPLARFKTMGASNNHIKLEFEGLSGVEFVGFGLAEEFNRLLPKIDNDVLPSFDIAGYLDINEWNGRKRLQFVIKDIRTSPKVS